MKNDCKVWDKRFGNTNETSYFANRFFAEYDAYDTNNFHPVFRNGTPILAILRDNVKQLRHLGFLIGV